LVAWMGGSRARRPDRRTERVSTIKKYLGGLHAKPGHYVREKKTGAVVFMGSEKSEEKKASFPKLGKDGGQGSVSGK